jgi:hypothetical protein
MTNPWDSFIAHWAIPVASWIFGTFMGATFRWFYPSRKEWKEERREKAERKMDADVLRALAGGVILTSAWIADGMKAEREQVIESLDRLEHKGRVQSDSGTMDNPARVYWILE